MTKSIKFFISSTFKDFENERNILKKFVFLKLKDLCHRNGFGFQPIDLRWGIQEEAGYDQQTMNICLNEIKRSSYDPKPNLLLLVGQRYGWVPIPYEIENELFLKILNPKKLEKKDINLLKEWYELDENSIPNTYYLKNKWIYKNDRKSWSAIENKIRFIFQKVIDESFSEDIYRKFHTSATEQEMYLGLDAFDKTKNHEHTFTYFRELENYDLNDKSIEEYIDKDLSKLKQLKVKLQNESNIPKKNQINIKTAWNESKVSTPIKYEELSLQTCPKYLVKFFDEILEKFTNSINNEIENYNINKTTELQIELKQQKEFLKEKSKIVLGRTTEVNRILEFIKNDDEQFYLQYGKSGSGKTSIMAKAITDLKAEKSEYTVLYRFIGTTANSTYSRQVFESIYWEIESQLENQDDISKPQLEIEEKEFKKQFKSQLEKLKDKKVVIFLDALDQFTDYDDLTILLEELPSNIKIVFSILYDENKKDNNDYFQYFNRLGYLENKYELLPLKENTNKEILKSWLNIANRDLSKFQWNFLDAFLKDITPLHLKLIFEIVKHWKSEQKDLYLEDTQEKLIIQFFNFIQKQYYHEVKLIENTMGLISASKDGLSEEEILDLLSSDKGFLTIYESERYPKLDSLPNAIWSRFYYYIEPFFTEKLIDGELLINPYHRIIEEVIKDTYYNKQKHIKLAEYFNIINHYNKKTFTNYNLRSLSELPYQYIKIDTYKLLDLLKNFEFMVDIFFYKKDGSFFSDIYKIYLPKTKSEDNYLIRVIEDFYSFYSEFREKLINYSNFFSKNTYKKNLLQFILSESLTNGWGSVTNKYAQEYLKKNSLSFFTPYNIPNEKQSTKLLNRSKHHNFDGVINIYKSIDNTVLSIGDDSKINKWTIEGVFVEEFLNNVYSTKILDDKLYICKDDGLFLVCNKKLELKRIQLNEPIHISKIYIFNGKYFIVDHFSEKLYIVNFYDNLKSETISIIDASISNNTIGIIKNSKELIIKNLITRETIFEYKLDNEDELFRVNSINDKFIFSTNNEVIYIQSNKLIKRSILNTSELEEIIPYKNYYLFKFRDSIYNLFVSNIEDKLDFNIILESENITFFDDSIITTDVTAIEIFDQSGHPLTIISQNKIREVGFSAHKKDINHIAVLNNRTFLTISLEDEAKIWKVDGTCLRTFNAETNEGISLVKAIDDEHFLIADYDGTISFYSTYNKKITGRFDSFNYNGFILINKPNTVSTNYAHLIVWTINQITLFDVFMDKLISYYPDGEIINLVYHKRSEKIIAITSNNQNTFLEIFSAEKLENEYNDKSIRIDYYDLFEVITFNTANFAIVYEDFLEVIDTDLNYLAEIENTSNVKRFKNGLVFTIGDTLYLISHPKFKLQEIATFKGIKEIYVSDNIVVLLNNNQLYSFKNVYDYDKNSSKFLIYEIKKIKNENNDLFKILDNDYITFEDGYILANEKLYKQS